MELQCLTLQSLSSLQAGAWFAAVAPRGLALPGATGSDTMATGLMPSTSKEAALMLGGVSEAAAQPIDTPILLDVGFEADTLPGDGCGHTARWGRKAMAFWDWIGVTAAVGRSWLWHTAKHRAKRKGRTALVGEQKCHLFTVFPATREKLVELQTSIWKLDWIKLEVCIKKLPLNNALAWERYSDILPVLTALRAWFTVICDVTCMSTLGCWPGGMWAAVTTAAGMGLEGAGPVQIGRGLLGSTPPRAAPIGEDEELTMVTPRPACEHIPNGTLGWLLLATVLKNNNNKNIYILNNI